MKEELEVVGLIDEGKVDGTITLAEVE